MVARTPDLGFAAALVTLGHDLLPTLESGASERQKVFCFPMSQDDLEQLFKDYRGGRMVVDAHANAQSIKRMKRTLYGDRPQRSDGE